MKFTDYQKDSYDREAYYLLVDFLNTYDVETAIDLGCGSGNETVYMIKKGIKVTSIDKELNKNYILNRLSMEERKLLRLHQESFENIELPKTELIVAIFSIFFCNPKEFDKLWDKIYNALEEDGYFVGQLLGDRDDWNKEESINTFSIEQVKGYLKKYEIIKLQEREYIREIDNKKWHFYDIVAKKKR